MADYFLLHERVISNWILGKVVGLTWIRTLNLMKELHNYSINTLSFSSVFLDSKSSERFGSLFNKFLANKKNGRTKLKIYQKFELVPRSKPNL